MKTKFTKIFITIFAVAIIATGISYVSAQTTQTNGPSNPDTYTKDLPVFTGENLQQKKGGFLSQKHIGAPVGFFKKSIYLPGSDSKLRIGSANGALSINPALFGDTSMEPVVIDMQNRAARTDATKFINGGQCAVATRLVTTNAAAYEFKTGNNLGNVIARQVQLTGGDPDAGEVLVSDANGNARWAKATVSGGQVVFDNDSTSPVPAGQCIAPEPIVDVCTNIDDAQPTVPTGMVKDTPGDTPGNCTIPPVDLCTNIAGDQTNIPTGMVKDTPGDTPGNCTIPPVDLCPNITGTQTAVPSGYDFESSTGKCFKWVDYTDVYTVKGNVGESCASYISRMSAYQPYQPSYVPVTNGKFRTVELQHTATGAVTGSIIGTYPDKCIYAKTTSNNNNSNSGDSVLGDLQTVPTENSGSNSYNIYFFPRAWVNGGTPWRAYKLQYKSYE